MDDVEERLPVEYILPIRWSDDTGWPELERYLRWLCGHVDVTLVDGSPSELRRAHASAVRDFATVIEPDATLGSNGKVAAVLTAGRSARHTLVIIADDDVRYGRSQLERMVELLQHADLVRPQNYFSPLPWHARWDTARTLINRSMGSDFPGTLGVRASHLRAGYDGDVLFENLELIRTIIARGGSEIRADDLFVARRPPTVHGFFSQRVRQAYDSLAQPLRLAAELAIVPAVILLARRPMGLLGLFVASLLAAERGRRTSGGAGVFDAWAALWAPLWLAERGVCAWLAVIARLRGGIRYRGRRLQRAAHSVRELRGAVEANA